MNHKLVWLAAILSLISAVFGKEIRISGPFRGEAFAFYIVHEGGPLKVEVLAKHRPDRGFYRGGNLPVSQKKWAADLDGKVLIRFMDADERTVKRDLLKLGKNESSCSVFDYRNAPAGIYVIRTAAGNAEVDLNISPKKKFGVMASRCMIQASHPGQFARTNFFIPSGFQNLKLRVIGCSGSVKDENGKVLLPLSAPAAVRPETIDAWMDTDRRFPAKNLALAGLENKVLTLDLNMEPGEYVRFGAFAMPLILCPDSATARAIAGSVERASDGRLFSHKYQVRAYEWMKNWKESDGTIAFRNLADFRTAFEKEPESAALLGSWGVLGAFESVIRNQKLDKNSPDFGITHHLLPAIVLSMNKPYNPYYRNEALRKRMLLNMYAYYLKINESDTYEDSDDSYTGLDSFIYSYLAEAAYYGAPMIADPRTRELFCEGALRLADRFPFFHAHCENQSAHYLIGHYFLGKLPENRIYSGIARDYAADLSDPKLNPYMKTGYYQEREGLDATYVGLAACIQTVYYRDSGNLKTLESLRRLFTLMNHTVAPEPDGRILGASGFAVRTAGSWAQRQWGGGSSMLRGVLSEAAVWHRGDVPRKTPDWNRLLIPVPESVYVKNPHFRFYAGRMHTEFYYSYLFPAKAMKGDFKFPAEESGNFERNFNDEFRAVKNGKMYAFFSQGNDWPEYHEDELHYSLDRPLNFRRVAPPVQGLHLLWFPGYGNALLGMNWVIQTQPCVVVELSGRKASMPEFRSCKTQWNPDTKTMNYSWKMRALPVRLERTVSIANDGLAVKVTLLSDRAWSGVGTYEQIPLSVKKNAELFFRTDKGWEKTASAPVRSVWYGCEGKSGVMILFDRPVPVSVWGPQTLSDVTMISLRLGLGSCFRANEKVSLEWKIFQSERK